MDEKLKRKATIQWVSLDKMRVRTGIAQRELKQARVDALAKDFDIDRFRRPVVNRIGEWFWIVDGQHSTGAYKQWLGEWKGQKVECEVHHDLSIKEEADLFDWLNNTSPVSAYDKFVTRVTAEREEETNISAIAHLRGLKIARSRDTEAAVSCVSTLRRVYQRGGPDVLDASLKMAYEGFGESGLDSDIIDGLGHLIARYNGRIEQKRAIVTFGAIRGGVNSLRSRAERLRQQTGTSKVQCIAAAAVEIINRGKGGKKLPGWFKEEA